MSDQCNHMWFPCYIGKGETYIHVDEVYCMKCLEVKTL